MTDHSPDQTARQTAVESASRRRTEAVRNVLTRIRRSPVASTALGLLVVWILLTIASPRFLTSNNLLNIFLQSSNVVILAGGVTLTLIAGEIDLSVGSVEAFAGAVMAVLMVNMGVPWPIALLAGLLTGLMAGGVSGFFTTKYGMPSFVTTLAMLGIARGFALVITDGTPVFGLPSGFDWIGQGKIGPVAVPIVIAAFVVILLHLLLTRTVIGLNIYAVGGNSEAARLAGINVRRVKLFVLAMSGFTAAIGGAILAARLDAGAGTLGESDLLDAVAAVVIGGTSLMGGVGSIPGTVIGVVLITSIRNGLVLLNINAFWQQVAIGALILAAVLLDHLAKASSSQSR